jgi:hypothetical protein
MNRFIAEYLSGKLRSVDDSKEMAKRALMATTPMNKKNTAARKPRKQPHEQVRGVTELFGDGTPGDMATVAITLANFDEIALNEEKDVVLMLHERGSQNCAGLAVYYKKMAERFADMNLDSLIIAQMDITDESPPGHLNLVDGKLPIVAMLPAYAKHPPWTFFSGYGKVQEMMKWVHSQSTVQFELPNLPHLTPEQRVLYKEQIREREEWRENKRKEDEDALVNEEKEREEYEQMRRRKQREKAQEIARQKQAEYDATKEKLEKMSKEEIEALFAEDSEADAAEAAPADASSSSSSSSSSSRIKIGDFDEEDKLVFGDDGDESAAGRRKTVDERRRNDDELFREEINDEF